LQQSPPDKVRLPIRTVLAVASAKGGVGKTTCAVNLAIALGQSGQRVGLLDADIFGPNVPMMMGVAGAPEASGPRLAPKQAHGIKLMSLGLLLRPDQPVVWRGPLLHTTLREMLTEVDWGQLDTLLIDLPPGTGDVQLSLAQSTQLTGAIIVTTPSEVALADVQRGLVAFRKLGVPLLGVIENMSEFCCPHCGEPTTLFGHDGGHRIAEELALPFLGKVPLQAAIREGGDQGRPVTADPSSPEGRVFQAIARRVVLAAEAASGPPQSRELH